MPFRTKKILAVLLCALMAFGAALPAFADEPAGAEPTWQNTIASVTPLGDAPYVKLKLTAEGYKITECRLPQEYEVVFKDGTSVKKQITGEPSHTAPLILYETYFDVETAEGTITLYAKVMLAYEGAKEAYFSVGQYVLQGSMREDGTPAAGSEVYEFPILEEPCEAETDEGGFFTRVLYFFYRIYLKAQRWFVSLFHKLFAS